MTRQRVARRHPQQWVVDRLVEWGRWIALTGLDGSRGYKSSSLALDPNRGGGGTQWVPRSFAECERTHEALRKQPLQFQRLAGHAYVQEMDYRDIAVELGCSARHVARLLETLWICVGNSLTDQRVRYPLGSKPLS